MKEAAKFLQRRLFWALPWATMSLGATIFFSGNSSSLTLGGVNASLSLDTSLSNFTGILNVTDKTDNSITQTAAGNKINFSAGGSLQLNNLAAGGDSSNNYHFDGAFDAPSGGSNTLIFSGNNTLNVAYGSIAEDLTISGAGNVINGIASFDNAFALTDSATSLNLGLESKLNQSITLNDGTVKLTKNLEFKDGSLFLGDGTVNVNNFTLKFPYEGSSVWAGSITWQNANDITISKYTTLNGTWTFGGSGTHNINGNGSFLDLSGGGTINVGAGTTLNIVGVHIKGLGASGGNIAINATGTVNLSHTTIELLGDYALSSGTMAVIGDNCTVIAMNDSQINITGAGTVFKVDGVILRYNALDSTANNPVVPSAGGVVTLLHNGSIMADYVDSATGINYTFSSPLLNLAPNCIQLSSGTIMRFVNTVPATPKAMTFDGQGNYLDFCNTGGTPLRLDANVTLTFQNIIIHNFNPSQISFGGAGPTLAKIIFGDNVSLYYAQDTVFSSYAALVFNGNALIDGGGSTLKIASQKIKQTGAGKTLTLRNAKLVCEAVDSIVNTTDTSSLTLQNINLAMNNLGFTCATGHLNILDNATIYGSDPTTPSGTSRFTFSSKGLLTIRSNSILNIAKNTIFKYNPDISADGAVLSVEKRHMVFTDPTSVWQLDNSIVETGTVGMALDYGSAYIDGLTTFNISTATDAQLDLGSAFVITIAPGANLQALGPITYTTTTYP